MQGRSVLAVFFFCCCSLAATADDTAEAREFLYKLVSDYGTEAPPTDVFYDGKVFALDMGKEIPKAEYARIWRAYGEEAFRAGKGVSDYRKIADIRVFKMREGLLKEHGFRAPESYEADETDLLVLGVSFGGQSKAKDVEYQIVHYPKAFIFVIRKVKRDWKVVAIGG